MLKDGTPKPLDAVLTETKVETKTQGKFIKNAGASLLYIADVYC